MFFSFETSLYNQEQMFQLLWLNYLSIKIYGFSPNLEAIILSILDVVKSSHSKLLWIGLKYVLFMKCFVSVYFLYGHNEINKFSTCLKTKFPKYLLIDFHRNPEIGSWINIRPKDDIKQLRFFIIQMINKRS